MNQFKGTKGKWKLVHSQSKIAWNIIGTVLGGRYKIARCPYLKSDISSDTLNKLDEQEAKANAQLIAAAPELLEASQLLLHYHLCEQEGMLSGQPTPAQWLQAVDKLSEAIFKALGKENQP